MIVFPGVSLFGKKHDCGDKHAQLILQEQEAHVHKYLGYMHGRNAILLPAIVNPGPMSRESPPPFYTLGSPQEAYLVFMHCCRHFARIPNALQRIEDFVGRGPHPAYDSTPTL